MKKYIACLLTLLIVSTNIPTFAMSVEESEAAGLVDTRIQPEKPADAPKWVEYVPAKYQNPRTDFKKGPAITELVFGIILTDLLFTAPIGIPMICHSTTKLKNIGWAEKKVIFFDGLEEANKISNAEERTKYYTKLRSQCKLSDKKHEKQLKRMAKAETKTAKAEAKTKEKAVKEAAKAEAKTAQNDEKAKEINNKDATKINK